jgi:hypothetical protein
MGLYRADDGSRLAVDGEANNALPLVTITVEEAESPESVAGSDHDDS